MSEQGEKWLASMVAKYGSEEKVRAEMKRRQEKSMENPNRQKGNHHGGFSNKELAKKASKKGLQVRWGYTRSNQG